MKPFCILLFILIISFLQLSAQSITQVSHLSTENGLSENNVISIFQDRKGFMWFGTFDGLNRFDGYTFKTYKGGQGSPFALQNNRIDRIKEDYKGFIWLSTNDGRIYRLNPSTDAILPIPQCLDEFKNYKKQLREIFPLADSSIWVIGGTTGDNECFRFYYTKKSDKIQFERLNPANGKVKSIFLDQNRNTWILTDKGTFLRKRNTTKNIALTKCETGNYSACETASLVYLGGDNGILKIYNPSNGSLEFIKTPFPAPIRNMHSLKGDKIFILTDKKGFYLFDTKKRSFETFSTANLLGLRSNILESSYKDKFQNIWLNSVNNDIILFNTATKKITCFKPSSETAPISNYWIVEDKLNNLWINSRTDGFCRYNRLLNKLEPFPSYSQSSEAEFPNNILSAFVDFQGNLWLGPKTYGIVKIAFRESPFNFQKPRPDLKFSELNEVRSLFFDKDNKLWVGTQKGNVYLYDNNHKLIGYLGIDGRINSSQPFSALIYRIIADHYGNIWLASRTNGLYKITPKGQGKALLFTITNYQNEPNNKYSLSSNYVFSVFEDHLHRIWVATLGGGVNLIETKNGKTIFINPLNNLRQYPKQCYRVRYITEDSKKQIYVGTNEGLIAFKCDNTSPEKIILHHYKHDVNNVNSLPGDEVHYILPARNGDLYLGIYGRGVCVVNHGLKFSQTPQFNTLKKEDSSLSEEVFSIQEDLKGYIWLASKSKLVKYNSGTKKTDVYSPISKYPFTFEPAVCKVGDSQFVYGTTQGFVWFNPLTAAKSKFTPRISFTQLNILNKPAIVGAKNSPLTQSIDDSPELNLSHSQDIISINFAALDYSDPSGIKYAYKMEGIDSDWNYVDNQHSATYTNLPKGKYFFKVKSTNADGEWVNNERSIRIIKSPSFWESVWGYLFYFLLIIGIVILATYLSFTFYRLKNEIQVEQRITEIKISFFADISHELRTPLTLIVSPVENMLRKLVLPENVKEQLIVVKRNADRMLRLINQILDFHKIQSNKMKLHLEEVVVAQLVNEICFNFQKLAEDRNVGFHVEDNSNNARLWLDKDKFEIILFNLLSNAFKFTQWGNSVTVSIVDNHESVSISVRDNGIGISKENIKKLFSRFESWASSDKPLQTGTGIGLSHSKELADLHKASIEAESELGKGSTFKVTFLKGLDHFNKDNDIVLTDFENNRPVSENNQEENDGFAILPAAHTEEVPTVLIVEDNRELRAVLCSGLKDNYNVLEAENGKLALELLQTNSPDLVISDIMMPEMSGFEFTKAIKEDVNTSHIPIILLTARTDLDSKLEAMEAGVDDYITKPFSSAYLEARVENLLNMRRQLQEYYRSSLTSGVINTQTTNIGTLDDVLIRRIVNYINENIEDPDLSIDGIAQFLKLSRSSMFRKIKSLTGLAPVDFIKEIRIQHAVELIETGEYNISQVAYKVGMDNPKYFSKCFKQKFGVNPSEYKDKCTFQIKD